MLLNCNKKTNGISKPDLDVITDGVERCLTNQIGLEKFKDFLESNNFDEKLALYFWMKSKEFLETYMGRSSPTSMTSHTAKKILQKFIKLCDEGENVEWDGSEYEQLMLTKEKAIEKVERKETNVSDEIEIMRTANENIIPKLEQKYNLFKRKILQEYS